MYEILLLHVEDAMNDCGRQHQSEAIANKNDTSIKTS